jgi:hypothetical protein
MEVAFGLHLGGAVACGRWRGRPRAELQPSESVWGGTFVTPTTKSGHRRLAGGGRWSWRARRARQRGVAGEPRRAMGQERERSRSSALGREARTPAIRGARVRPWLVEERQVPSTQRSALAALSWRRAAPAALLAAPVPAGTRPWRRPFLPARPRARGLCGDDDYAAPGPGGSRRDLSVSWWRCLVEEGEAKSWRRRLCGGRRATRVRASGIATVAGMGESAAIGA